MSDENGEVREESVEVKKRESPKYRNSPKTSRDVIQKCKSEYEAGLWTSVRELAEKYGIATKTLHARIYRESWDVKRAELLGKIEKRVEENTLRLVDKQSEYLTKLGKRADRYEAMLDASVSQNSTTNSGVPVCDPDQIDVLSRSELRVLEMQRAAYKIPVASQLDVTSAGRSLGDSFVMAIQKLRDSNTPALNDSDLKTVLEAEIVD